MKDKLTVANFILLIILVISVVICFSFHFFTFRKFNEGISQKIKNTEEEISVRIDNQTSLFNRIIGENIPVIVPEEYENKFQDLKNSVDNFKKNPNDDELKKVTELYLNFIKQTPPWIQEQLSQEILTAKYNIDFYSIINEYNQTKNIEEAIDSLETFIASFNDYADIQKVIDYHNELVELQNEKYSSRIQDLKTKINASLNNKNITLKEVQSLLEESNEYSEDDSLKDSILDLNNLFSEFELKDAVNQELENIDKQLNQTEFAEFINNNYDLFSSKLVECLYNATSLKYLDNSDLLSEINSTAEKLRLQKENYELKIQQENEDKELSEIKNEIESCKKEAENIKMDSTFNATISVIASQLASLNFALKDYDNTKTAELYVLIDECKKELNNAEQKFSDERENLKIYNSNTLNLIKKINTENSNLKGNRQEKSNAKISMLKRLDEIDISYLYLPVNTLYQEIYQSIWNSLENEDKTKVAENALMTNKKALYENF